MWLVEYQEDLLDRYNGKTIPRWVVQAGEVTDSLCLLLAAVERDLDDVGLQRRVVLYDPGVVYFVSDEQDFARSALEQAAGRARLHRSGVPVDATTGHLFLLFDHEFPFAGKSCTTSPGERQPGFHSADRWRACRPQSTTPLSQAIRSSLSHGMGR